MKRGPIRRGAPDGHLTCRYLERVPERRWTNPQDDHALCHLGHLPEGASRLRWNGPL